MDQTTQHYKNVIMKVHDYMLNYKCHKYLVSITESARGLPLWKLEKWYLDYSTYLSRKWGMCHWKTPDISHFPLDGDGTDMPRPSSHEILWHLFLPSFLCLNVSTTVKFHIPYTCYHLLQQLHPHIKALLVRTIVHFMGKWCRWFIIGLTLVMMNSF